MRLLLFVCALLLRSCVLRGVTFLCLQMNGEGQCRWDHTGVVYIGQWMDNKRHGFGKQTAPDGSLYEVRRCSCVSLVCSLIAYVNRFCCFYRVSCVFPGPQGEFRDDMMDGYSTFTFADGIVYRGEFNCNKIVRCFVSLLYSFTVCRRLFNVVFRVSYIEWRG